MYIFTWRQVQFSVLPWNFTKLLSKQFYIKINHLPTSKKKRKKRKTQFISHISVSPSLTHHPTIYRPRHRNSKTARGKRKRERELKFSNHNNAIVRHSSQFVFALGAHDSPITQRNRVQSPNWLRIVSRKQRFTCDKFKSSTIRASPIAGSRERQREW